VLVTLQTSFFFRQTVALCFCSVILQARFYLRLHDLTHHTHVLEGRCHVDVGGVHIWTSPRFEKIPESQIFLFDRSSEFESFGPVCGTATVDNAVGVRRAVHYSRASAGGGHRLVGRRFDGLFFFLPPLLPVASILTLAGLWSLVGAWEQRTMRCVVPLCLVWYVAHCGLFASSPFAQTLLDIFGGGGGGGGEQSLRA
jgi:hypothetical protein